MEAALALVATAISALFLIPQLLRLRRTGDTGGVSWTAASVGLITTVAWAAYGFGTGSGALIPPSLVGATQYALLLGYLRHRRDARRAATGVASAWSAVLVGAGLASAATRRDPWVGVGAALAGAALVQYVPAVVDARRSETVHGISRLTWALVGASGATWIAYGLVAGDGPVAAYGFVLFVAAVAILAVSRRPRTAPAHPEGVGRPP